MVKKSDYFVITLLFSFALFFLYLYFYIDNTQKEIENRIINNKIKHMTNALSHISDDIVKLTDSEDLVVHLKNHKDIRISLERQLAQMLSKNTKYTYFLYLDNQNKFRFLLDGSLDDKARFYQKFDPLKKELYFKVYETKQKEVIFQQNIENLLITILYPVKKDNQVIGILSVDMTTGVQNDIIGLIEPLKNFFIVLVIFISLLIFTGVIQLFKYFKTKKQLFHDSLTNIYNRHYLEDISLTMKLSDYSIAMLDLDRFKMVNDTYGHKTGDVVLQECAKIFQENIRKNDILIRYGGEEFLLLMYKKNNEDNSFEVCKNILDKTSKNTIMYDGNEINMTLSIGLNQNVLFDKDLTESIKKADSMLYLAKQRGRDQIVKYHENMQNVAITNKKGVDDVKSALNEDRIVCHFQPIVDAKTKNILKYEALVRIESSDGKTIYPNDFLPYIKHTNIHYKLTKKILEICFDTFSKNTKHISINVSFLDLLNRDIVEYITKTLQHNPQLASRITFEILESAEIEDINIFKEKIDILHKLGAKIAIDDFGSGYSNFKAVLDVRADFLKIDGTLIKDIDTDEKVFQVVKNIIFFAKDSGMRTIAEYVSNEEIHDRLMMLDIDYMQGFYLAKPTKEIVENIEVY